MGRKTPMVQALDWLQRQQGILPISDWLLQSGNEIFDSSEGTEFDFCMCRARQPVPHLIEFPEREYRNFFIVKRHL